MKNALSKRECGRRKSIFRFVRQLIPKDNVSSNEKEESNSYSICKLAPGSTVSIQVDSSIKNLKSFNFNTEYNKNEKSEFHRRDFSESVASPLGCLNLDTSTDFINDQMRLKEIVKFNSEHLSDGNQSEDREVDFDDTDENDFDETLLCCNTLASTSNKVDNEKKIKSAEQFKSSFNEKSKFLIRRKSMTPTLRRQYGGSLARISSVTGTGPKVGIFDYSGFRQKCLRRRSILMLKRNASMGINDYDLKNAGSTPRRSMSFSTKNSELNTDVELVIFLYVLLFFFIFYFSILKILNV